MKIPVFLPVTREFGLRDEFARDCLLQQRVCELSVPEPAKGALHRFRREGSRRVVASEEDPAARVGQVRRMRVAKAIDAHPLSPIKALAAAIRDNAPMWCRRAMPSQLGPMTVGATEADCLHRFDGKIMFPTAG